MHELVDVVDEQDQVLRTLPREEVHAQGLLHRCVHVFVFDGQGRLWLQKRALDLRLYAGAWTSSASGHVDAGEDYLTAARREVEEELGLKVEPRKLAMFRFEDAEENELSMLCEARSDGKPDPHPDEVLAVLRVGPSELDELLARLPHGFAPSFAAAWRAWKGLRR